MSQKIDIDIGGGLRLVAKQDSAPYDREICIGVTDENGEWLQELALVRNAFMFEDTLDGEWAVKWYEGLFDVLVWPEADSNYCEERQIPFWAEPE